MFFCFADPHFKKVNHRRRIISTVLLTEYAYLMKPGGKVYIVTDVKDLFDWEHRHLEEHPLFEECPKQEIEDDPCVKFMSYDTDESIKVRRNGGSIWHSVFKRIEDTSSVPETELLKWFT